MAIEKRFVVYKGQHDTGYYGTNYTEINLTDISISELFSSIIGIYKSLESAKKVAGDRDYITEIDFEI